MLMRGVASVLGVPKNPRCWLCCGDQRRLHDAIAAVLPRINPILKALGWDDLKVTALKFAGLTYRDWGKPHISRVESREIGIDITFRDKTVERPQAFLNEARLSALALAILSRGP